MKWDQCIASFEENEIDGSVLLTLTLDELKSELNIREFGIRKKIFKAIQDLLTVSSSSSPSSSSSLLSSTVGATTENTATVVAAAVESSTVNHDVAAPSSLSNRNDKKSSMSMIAKMASSMLFNRSKNGSGAIENNRDAVHATSVKTGDAAEQPPLLLKPSATTSSNLKRPYPSLLEERTGDTTDTNMMTNQQANIQDENKDRSPRHANSDEKSPKRMKTTNEESGSTNPAATTTSTSIITGIAATSSSGSSSSSNSSNSNTAMEDEKTPIFSCSQEERDRLFALSLQPRKCVICLELFDHDFLQGLMNCISEHESCICRDCMRDYLVSEIESRNNVIRCPVPTCKKEIRPEDLEINLDRKYIEQFEELALKSAIENSSDCWHCLTPDCTYSFLYEKGKDSPDFQCPQCNKRYCIDCKVEYHVGATCQEYEKWSVENGMADDTFGEFVQSKRFQRCPKCERWVEKKSGCDHITCLCSHHFCYRCGNDYPCRMDHSGDMHGGEEDTDDDDDDDY